MPFPVRSIPTVQIHVNIRGISRHDFSHQTLAAGRYGDHLNPEPIAVLSSPLSVIGITGCRILVKFSFMDRSRGKSVVGDGQVGDSLTHLEVTLDGKSTFTDIGVAEVHKCDSLERHRKLCYNHIPNIRSKENAAKQPSIRCSAACIGGNGYLLCPSCRYSEV